MKSENLYWVWLSGKLGIANRDFPRLMLRYENPYDIYTASYEELSCVEGINRNTVDRLVDKSLEKFVVSVNMSEMSSKTLDKAPTKVVFLNQVEDYSYSVNYANSNLDEIVLIGPAESLEKITADDIQVEINVSSLSVNSRIAHDLKLNILL